MADMTLSASEQRAILENPDAIMLLMNWHDYQQDCADSMGAECHGNRDRYEQLKAHCRAIVLRDPEIWSDEVLCAFGVTRGVPVDQCPVCHVEGGQHQRGCRNIPAGVPVDADLDYYRACERQNVALLEAIGYPHEKDSLTSPEEYAAELKRKADLHDAHVSGVPLLDRKTFSGDPPMTRTQEQGEKR